MNDFKQLCTHNTGYSQWECVPSISISLSLSLISLNSLNLYHLLVSLTPLALPPSLLSLSLGLHSGVGLDVCVCVCVSPLQWRTVLLGGWVEVEGRGHWQYAASGGVMEVRGSGVSGPSVEELLEVTVRYLGMVSDVIERVRLDNFPILKHGV